MKTNVRKAVTITLLATTTALLSNCSPDRKKEWEGNQPQQVPVQTPSPWWYWWMGRMSTSNYNSYYHSPAPAPSGFNRGIVSPNSGIRVTPSVSVTRGGFGSMGHSSSSGT